MKFDILNRRSGAVQFTAEIECGDDAPTSVKLGLAVRVAVKDDANLADAYLAGANLARAYLAGAYLARANLADAYLAGANLARANLARANLAGANLAGANLAGANLAGANLADAYLAGANLADANLAGANLAGAYLAGAKELAKATWDGDGKMVCTTAPVFFLGANWPVMFSDAHIKIGCQVHATTEWAAFTDAQIGAMDGLPARKFWKQWKVAILALAEAHQSKVKAEPEVSEEAAE